MKFQQLKESHLAAEKMSDTLPELIRLIESSLKLLYSERLATTAAALFLNSSEEFRVYIIGCLLLTLTASVQPQFTLLSDRRRTLTPQFPPSSVADLAEAGLYLQEGSRLVCFHCSAKLASHTEGLTSAGGGLECHRTASPNCYFVRLVDFINSRGSDPRLGETVARDVGRYVKALRKLKVDLDCDGLKFAASFGFSARALAFFTTRHFMRSGGRVSDRAGDLIDLVHSYESLFHPSIPATVDVQELLKSLKLLATARGESGYHSVVIGRYDQQSGSWESTTQSLTSEQLRALQAVLSPLPSGGGSSGNGFSSI